MVSEIRVIDQVQINDNKTVCVREVTKMLRDNTEIARAYHRSTFTPGDKISDLPAHVQAIILAAWS